MAIRGVLPTCLTSSSIAQFFRGQPRESATEGGPPPFRSERRHSKAICILRVISNEMNGNRLNDRSRKFQHQGDRLCAGSKHLVGNPKLINARQQFAIDFNKASGSMFAELLAPAEPVDVEAAGLGRVP